MMDTDNMTKAQLITYYGLTTDDFGRYTAIAEPHLLITTSFRQAALAGSDNRNWTDDDLDYTNAIIHQLAALHMLIFDCTQTGSEADDLLDLLNLTQDEARDHDDDNVYAFVYGFADHYTHISTLAHMNDED